MPIPITASSKTVRKRASLVQRACSAAARAAKAEALLRSCSVRVRCWRAAA